MRSTASLIIDRGITLIFLILPFQWALRPIEGIDLPLIRVYILVLFAFWLIASFWKKSVILPTAAPAVFLILLLMLAGISLFWEDRWLWGARKLLFLTNFFLIIPVLSDRMIQNFRLRHNIIHALVTGAGIAAIVALAQFMLQFIVGLEPILNFWRTLVTPIFLGPAFAQAVTSFSSWLVEISGQPVFRAVGLFPDPHMAAFYFGITFPWAVLLALKSGSQKKYWALAILILLSDLATFSRGGYLGLLTGFMLVAILNIQKIFQLIQTHRLRMVLGATVTVGALILIIYSPFSARFISSFNPAEGSNFERMRNWQEALSIIYRHPWGVGIGNYGYEINYNAQYRDPYYAHNLFLDIGAELGILGLILFILSELSAFGGFIHRAAHNSWAKAGIISMGIFFAHSLFETPLYSIHILPLIILLFILSASVHEQAELLEN